MIKCRVPQGSILGPHFFSIYMFCIANLRESYGFDLYADDAQLYLPTDPNRIDHPKHTEQRYVAYPCSPE